MSNHPTPPRLLPPSLLLYLLLLPVLAIAIATAAAIAGQQNRLDQEHLRIARDRNIAEKNLALAELAHADAATLADLTQTLDRENTREPISYARPGRHFTNWDAYRYEDILTRGYVYHLPTDSPDIKDSSTIQRPGWPAPRLKNVVWYPLYPLLGYIVAKSFSIPGSEALTLVSQFSILLTVPLLFLFARRHYEMELPSSEAGRVDGHLHFWAGIVAVTLLLFNPCSIFLYANFTESLFVLLLMAFLCCLQRRWWWAAAGVAAIASASRSQGVLFGPILALVFLVRDFRKPLPKLGVAVVLGMISGLGILAYMIYLQVTFHDAVAFMHAQKYWNVGINAGSLAYAANPLHAAQQIWHYAFMTTPMDWPRLWEAFCLLWPPVLLLLFRKRLTFELALVGWIFWGLPYVSNSLAGYPPASSQWMSMGRFMAVLVPVWVVLGKYLARKPRLLLLVLLLSASIFALFSYKFGAGEWIG